jgi:LPXTG-motif cell wall-anchored protein
MTKFFTALVLGLMAMLLGATPALADGHGNGKDEHVPVGICHATSSATNPYVFIVVDDDSAKFKGHLMHRNDPNKKNGRDYISDFTDTAGVFHKYDGVITSIANCPKPVVETPTPTPTETTVVTPPVTPPVVTPTETPVSQPKPTKKPTPKPTVTPTVTPTTPVPTATEAEPIPDVTKTPKPTLPTDTETPVTVTRHTLPHTGAMTPWIIVLGLGLLIAGGTFLAASGKLTRRH